MEQVQWYDLPVEILHIIFHKLKDPSDIYRCGLVCVLWKSVAKTVLPHCLLLSNVDVFKDETGRSHSKASLNKQSCVLLNTQTSETHEISLPEVEGRWFCSSSFGWLLTIGFKTPHKLRLLNPFTSDQIELPSAREFIRPDHLRVITSSSPLDPKCLVLAARGYYGELAFCRPGDESWTRVQFCDSFDCFCSDAIFYKDKFYAVGYSGDLFRISSNIIPIAAKLPLQPIRLAKANQLRKFNYLVELDGNLLLVARYGNHISSYVTFVFEVYELNCVEKQWIKVKSIGNNAILLGINSSISLRVSPARNFKANCIYFIDDDINNLSFITDSHQCHTGFYDMMTGNTEYLYQSSAIWTSPLNWFIPALPDIIYREKTEQDICRDKGGAEETSWSSRILTCLQNWFTQKL
ncbi:hypothetical protein EZV62_025458 [Acer yangbiense]|uniref:F-box domain-containing protein n=1 Tax=Acer yangbiense TaxID=1000413 RepID=A0A5C7GXV5_9ROSI|nr:hypothetical protein EZV62_025458 [Acer yangbiense]